MDVHVSVPKLQAEFAAALGQDLAALKGSEQAEVRAALEAAPEPVLGALDGVIEAGEALVGALSVAREGVPLRSLDLVIDRVMGGVVRTLRQREQVWSFGEFVELDAQERAQLEAVRAALADLDADGLGFLRLPFARQYYRNVVFLVAARRHMPVLEALGLGSAVARLELLNGHFGAAQGLVDAPRSALNVPVGDVISRALAAFEQALNTYCLEVAYHYRAPQDAPVRALLLGALERQAQQQRAAQERDAARPQPKPEPQA